MFLLGAKEAGGHKHLDLPTADNSKEGDSLSNTYQLDQHSVFS